MIRRRIPSDPWSRDASRVKHHSSDLTNSSCLQLTNSTGITRSPVECLISKATNVGQMIAQPRIEAQLETILYYYPSARLASY